MTQNTRTLKEQIERSKTWGDAQKIVRSMTGEQLITFQDALQIVEETFGLTMRDNFYLSLIRSEIKERARRVSNGYSASEVTA